MPSPSSSAGEPNTLRKRLEGRNVDHLLPEDAEAARELLDGVIGWQLESLKDTLAEHERRAARNAALEKDVLAFDASREGDVLRRYRHLALAAPCSAWSIRSSKCASF